MYPSGRIKNTLLSSVAAAVVFLLAACGTDDESPALLTANHKVLYNVGYAVNNDTAGQPQQLLLDIYLPDKRTSVQKFPLLMFIHGGSYLSGNKESVSASCKILADSGFIVASIMYRLGWRNNENCNETAVSLKEAAYRGMQDANAALRFLSAQAQVYDIDTNWIFIAGESAGAAIALNSSYTTDQYVKMREPGLFEKLGGLHNAGNFYPSTYTVKGICNKWGAISDSTLITAVNAIPVISFHGMYDATVPVDKGYFLGCMAVPAYGALCIHRRILAANETSVVYLKQNGMHQPEEFSPEFTMRKTSEFFHSIMEGKGVSETFVD